MGRGGGGGGGRSFGGGSRGGSRSSGGRRGGGGSSRGGFRSSGYHSSPSYHHNHYHPVRHYHHHGGGYVSSGSSMALTIVVLVIVALVFLVSSFKGGGVSITPSTIDREPLPAGYVTETGYYEDRLGWIDSQSKLESGMKSFYKKTGVQPFLYLTDTVNGDPNPSDAEMEEFANKLYDELFSDEAHLLLVFQEYNSSGNYFAYYVAGKQAKTVVDQEAADILLDYIDSYYYSDKTESEFFGDAFRDAGDRMMDKTTNPIVVIAVVIGVIVVIVVVFMIINSLIKHKEKETEATERILNTDLGDLADSASTDNLEDKYK